jgi:hypothetical protein
MPPPRGIRVEFEHSDGAKITGFCNRTLWITSLFHHNTIVLVEAVPRETLRRLARHVQCAPHVQIRRIGKFHTGRQPTTQPRQNQKKGAEAPFSMA